jgi:16S rRNA processing protein RimM
VGHIGRAHGLKGEVVVHLTTNRADRVDPGTVLHGKERSLEVVRSQRLKGTSHRVRFADVDGREAAEAIRGTTLWAEPIEDDEAVWAHEVIGAVVVDQHGAEHGPVVAMEANPASDLLVLESGGLVPVRFVRVVEAGRRVDVDIPDGLLG